MQCLLHDDYVIHAIQSEDTRILELCSKQALHAWVATSSIPRILDVLSRDTSEEDARRQLHRFLSAIALLPVGGTELKTSLKPGLEGPAVALSLRLAANRYNKKYYYN